MCGRYTQTAGPKALLERFKAEARDLTLAPRYNIAPTQPAPVVLESGGRRLELFRWGLIPSWAKDASIGHRLINARAETVLEKPSFKRPFERSRCLVAADGFYEWKPLPGSKAKTPMRVALKSREPFAMAGLWDSWKDPEGREVRSFTIITTEASPSLKGVHERMPAILGRADEERWLDPKQAPAALLPLLKPYAEGELEAYEVSTLVNAPANDVPQCVEAV